MGPAGWSARGGAPGPGVGRDRARRNRADGSVAGAMGCLLLMVEKPSWGGSEQLIYARGPSLLVTGVTTLRVTRRKGDLWRVAARVPARRSPVEIPGLSPPRLPGAVLWLLARKAAAGVFLDLPPGRQPLLWLHPGP